MKDTREILLEVVKDVSERFAFLFIEADDTPSWQGGADDLQATVQFSGKHNGTLTLVAPKPLCLEMAANVLGMDASEIGKTAGEETLKELLNIICGMLTWSLYGDREVFDVSAPVVSKANMNEVQKLLSDKTVVRLTVDEQAMLLHVKLSEPRTE